MSATVANLGMIAQRVRAAQDATRNIECLSADPAFDLATGYRVGHLVHEMRVAQGWRVLGRKIGFTNAAMWEVYGVHAPIWGYVYDTRRIGPGASVSLRGLADPKLEPEIALHFRSAPPAGADAAAILACADEAAHVFEIVQTHFAGWKFKAPDSVADNGLHGAMLIGRAQPIASLGPDPAAALAECSIALASSNGTRETGNGRNALGSPLIAIAHLVEVLARQDPPVPVQAGEWITTGTLTAAYPIKPGETWTTTVSGMALPGLAVTFTE
jgi:2-keto-4-pentenoate hydratase